MPIWGWWRKAKRSAAAGPVADRIRVKYTSFRDLLAWNNECLEIMAELQEDLQYIPPRRGILEPRLAGIFERTELVVAALDRLTGMRHPALGAALENQRQEMERYMAARDAAPPPRLAVRLSEVGAGDVAEVGGKAAVLGEIRGRLGLPVPEGFVLTTEAYRQYCGVPCWTQIRAAARQVDLNDLEALAGLSRTLTEMALAAAMPPAVEEAIVEGARALVERDQGLAVRSSAVGEGGVKTCAGQFVSLLNVPPEQAVEAYQAVVAGRFSERALFYRLSTGLLEVDSPMAALVLPVLPARAAGIVYTRDPNDPKSRDLWITATRGLGLEIASGRIPADLFRVARHRPHTVLESQIVRKEEEYAPLAGGGVGPRPLRPAAMEAPSLQTGDLHTLAEWGVRLEEHFRCPQDIEWVLGEDGRLWIVQARPLALGDASRGRGGAKPRGEPRMAGGRTVYPGRVSGQAFRVEDIRNIGRTPSGAVVFMRRPSPEIVEVFPRIAGFVADSGNITGHAAALLREFQIPSVFGMRGAFDQAAGGEPVSLDAAQARIYPGTLWSGRRVQVAIKERYRDRNVDSVGRYLLALNLVDPTAMNFRPSGCKSVHDVLRYCHEKGIEAMFEVNDMELDRAEQSAKELVTPKPLNVRVLDLGGGFAEGAAAGSGVTPEQIVSRPFQALWQGISHPGVSWTREMPASLGDLASVIASGLTPRDSAMRALGDKSYLLVAGDYMNLNSRLAYHFSLVDASLSDVEGTNYISFRFEGGGAGMQRRSLRACFIERSLLRYGFQVDRRGDLVNAWYRKAPAAQTERRLDILGRLLACSSQLDMYMDSHAVMEWYVEQFVNENYSFQRQPVGAAS
jgi:pyruvate,water dikinase